MDRIKIIKNFISKDDAERIINYINSNEQSFSKDPNGLWSKKFFGLDALYRAGVKGNNSIIEGVDEVKDLFVEISNKIKTLLAKEYEDSDDIFLNSAWFVKHFPGATVVEHSDLNDGTDYQFVYSSVIYLNTIRDGGNLEFPSLNLSIDTELGDLVIFPSAGEGMSHRVSDIGEVRYTFPMWFTKDASLELKFK